LKAFGYPHATVAAHFLMLGFIPVIAGAAFGIGMGTWFGRLVADVFGQFYRFPVLEYVTRPELYAIAVGVSLLGAVIGALGAVRRVLALPAAEAMRAEAPQRFGSGLLERLGFRQVLSPPMRMMLRNLERRPLKAVLTTFGIALAVAILVIGRFGYDAVSYMSNAMFRVIQRQDATVVFMEPRPARVRYDLLHVPGVLRVDPFRMVSVRLRSGYRSYRSSILGIDSSEGLRQLLDADLRPVSLPSSGILLTRRLGEILHVTPGDTVTVEVLEGSRPVRRVVVVGLVDELLGLSGYMNRAALDRLLQEGPALSGAYLMVDAALAQRTYEALKRTPAVAGVSVRQAVLQSFDETLATSMNISTRVMIVFACVIAAAVVYNSSRIALSERARELASLRVLGFTRREVSRILLAEQAVLTLSSLPIGFLLGYGLCGLMAHALSTDLYRFPLVVSSRTYAFSGLVVLAAALASALLVRRRVDRLDLVAVLKARE
jgi:putative ABC transport system permease protein